jgi:hypothetical protein
VAPAAARVAAIVREPANLSVHFTDAYIKDNMGAIVDSENIGWSVDGSNVGACFCSYRGTDLEYFIK